MTEPSPVETQSEPNPARTAFAGPRRRVDGRRPRRCRTSMPTSSRSSASSPVMPQTAPPMTASDDSGRKPVPGTSARIVTAPGRVDASRVVPQVAPVPSAAHREPWPCSMASRTSPVPSTRRPRGGCPSRRRSRRCRAPRRSPTRCHRRSSPSRGRAPPGSPCPQRRDVRARRQGGPPRTVGGAGECRRTPRREPYRRCRTPSGPPRRARSPDAAARRRRRCRRGRGSVPAPAGSERGAGVMAGDRAPRPGTRASGLSLIRGGLVAGHHDAVPVRVLIVDDHAVFRARLSRPAERSRRSTSSAPPAPRPTVWPSPRSCDPTSSCWT